MSNVITEAGECEDDLDLELNEFDEECGGGGGSTTCPSMDSRSNFPTRELDAEGKKLLMAEYQEVIKEIDNQNRVVNTLKMNIVDKALKPCKTQCQEREVLNLRCILERENIKLQCLLRKAMLLQEEDPTQTWDHIPLVTTFEEDSMPLQLTTMNAYNPPWCSTPSKSNVSCEKCDGETPNSAIMSNNKAVQSLLKKLLKEVKCNKDPASNKKNLKKLTHILKSCQEPECISGDKRRKDKSRSKRKSEQIINKELCQSYDMQSRLANDNSRLEGDRYELQNEVMQRDQTIDSLQNKINLLQCELQSLCKEKAKVLNSSEIKYEAKENRKLQSLEQNISTMENCMNKLRLEMSHLQKERSQWENTIKQGKCVVHDRPSCEEKRPRNNELTELKDNYAYLLSEYAKKDAELKALQDQNNTKVKSSESKTKCENGTGQTTEMDLLRQKLSDLQDEADEFKCLIKEQSEQLIEYQNKYLAAQQKVEEQKCLLNKLEISNKKIEDQINLEIRHIKDKFQEKLKELIQLPKLLENEQLKLAAACKEKDNLESKLRLVCRELKSIKTSMINEKETPDYSKRVKELETELATACAKIENLQKEKTMLCEKLSKTKNDLDVLRAESAKIVSRTKERAEQTRCALQQRLDCVEKELAQCRATACLSISDREEVIKEMQEQLNSMACNFDSAQNKIRTLKDHISYLSPDSREACK